jgi:Contact-dependent growth inhibition CdiA C-terminal domain
VNALLAADPPPSAGPPGMAPAPVLPGLEGVTPAAPGVAGPLPGLTAAPPAPPVPGLTPPEALPPLPGFGAADPGLVGPTPLESRADPGLTMPTGALNGVPTGPRSNNVPGAAQSEKLQVDSENQVADRLAAQGYAVVQNPTVGPAPAFTRERMLELALDPDKNPDLLINGRVFDTYTPVVDEARSIRSGIFKKVDDRQTDRVVVDLRGTTQTDASVRAALRADPVTRLKEVLTLTEAGLRRAFP